MGTEHDKREKIMDYPDFVYIFIMHVLFFSSYFLVILIWFSCVFIFATISELLPTRSFFHVHSLCFIRWNTNLFSLCPVFYFFFETKLCYQVLVGFAMCHIRQPYRLIAFEVASIYNTQI